MKLNYDLFSVHAKCGHCIHKYYKMDQDNSGPGYCSIIASFVEEDYYCSFYRMEPRHTKPIAIDPNGQLIQPEEDKFKQKRL